MATLREVLEYKIELDKAVDQNDISKSMDLVRILRGLDISFAVFKETKVGILVNRFRKITAENSAERSELDEILKAWRKAAEAEMKGKSGSGLTPPPSPVPSSPVPMSSVAPVSPALPAFPVATDALERGASPAHAGAPVVQRSVTPTPPLGSRDRSPARVVAAAPGTPVRPVSRPPTPVSPALATLEGFTPRELPNLVEGRVRVVRLFTDALASSAADATVAEDTSIAIEEQMQRAIGFTTDKSAYNVRARLIYGGLKSNKALCEQVLKGSVAPRELATMPDQKFAPEHIRAMLANSAAKAQEGRELDWEARNREKIREEIGASGVQGQYACGGETCGSFNTTYDQVQLASGDEPMTIFVQCLDCGRRTTM